MKKFDKNKLTVKRGRGTNIGSVIVLSLLFSATFIGASFGFKDSIENRAQDDTYYNQKVQFQTKVQIKDPSKDMKDAARSVQDTLDFLGKDNSKVQIMNDQLLITAPVSSYEWDTSEDETFVDSYIDETANSNYVKEIESLFSSLIFDGNLDFRTTTGLPVFKLNDEGKYELNVDGLNEGLDTGEDTRFVESVPEAKNFFKLNSAEVKHSNGQAYISVKLITSNNSEYLNMFKDWNTWIQSTGVGESTQYVVWFNYDKLEKIAETLDPDYDSATGLYSSYIETGAKWIRPFYVNTAFASPLSSKYVDNIELKGDFTESQATYFANKINNSNSFNYSDVSVTLKTESKNKVLLILLFSLFIAVVLAVIFTFVWFFGLLGLIAGISVILINMFTALILTGAGLSVSAVILATLSIIALIVSIISVSAILVYKKNNDDKNISITTRFKNKFMRTNSQLFAPVVSMIIIFYAASWFLTSALATPLCLISIMIAVAYIFVNIIILPLIYMFDLFTDFTNVDSSKKWIYLSGRNLEFDIDKYNIVASKSKAKIIAIVAGVLAIVSAIVAGTLFATTGSLVNSNLYGTRDYQYAIELVNKPTRNTIYSSDSTDSSELEGTYYIEEWYDAAESDQKDVEAAFKENGVKPTDISIIRNDSVETIDGVKLTTSFGYLVTSSKSIDSEKAVSINESLLAIDSSIEASEAEAPYQTAGGYKLSIDRYSFDGTQSYKVVDYTDNIVAITSLLAILLSIITIAIISLITSGWGIALATGSTVLIETSMITAPLFILYIPYSVLVWLPIVLFISLSGALKIKAANDVKKDENKTNSWERNIKSQRTLLPIFAALLLIIEIFFIFIYGFLFVLPLIIITIISPILILLTQETIFIFLAKFLGKYREDKKELQKNKDINKSKNKDNISEEYINGVNM